MGKYLITVEFGDLFLHYPIETYIFRIEFTDKMGIWIEESIDQYCLN